MCCVAVKIVFTCCHGDISDKHISIDSFVTRKGFLVSTFVIKQHIIVFDCIFTSRSSVVLCCIKLYCNIFSVIIIETKKKLKPFTKYVYGLTI